MSDNVARKEFHHALKDINKFFAKKTQKLSEFENDLFYIKKEKFLTLHKEDFEVLGDEGRSVLFYAGAPKIQWKTKEDVVFDAKIIFTDEETPDGELVEMNEMDMTDFSYDSENEIMSFFARFFWIDSGVNVMTDELFDGFSVALLVVPEYISSLEINLYYDKSKKIPIEFCDTSEIENSLTSILEGGEV